VDLSNKAPWITFRPEIKVLDCTIRDGGLVNDHQFDDDLVKAVYEACVGSGIDYMEIGYKNSKRLFPPAKYGPFRHSDEQSIRRIVGDNDTDLKLCCMADAEKCDFKTDILPKDQSVLDCIRVATYIHQIPVAVDMIHDAHEKGYEVYCNIMAVSTAQETELDQALEILAQTPASTIVVVDSFGAFYAEQIELLVKKYLKAVEGTGKQVGIHSHNNQQLAFANTIEAIIHGANRIDATIAGLGRGAGNCAMELLLGFLRNPKFHMRPIVQVLQDHFIKLRERIEWGPLLPYIITGQQNRHPREAMEMREGPRKDEFVAFYDRVVNDM